MAETLPNGPVVPRSTDRISLSGVDEIRTLGASVSGALGTALALTERVEADSKARDAALADDIAGMEGMKYVGAWVPGTTYRINDVVTYGGDSWARLTAGDYGIPGESPTNWGLVARKGDGGGFGELNETDVVGLYNTVEPPPWTPPAPTDLGTAHLDTITTPGDYTQIYSSRATKAQGYPHEGAAGIMSLREWQPGQLIATYTPWQANPMAKRTLRPTGWQIWYGVNGSSLP